MSSDNYEAPGTGTNWIKDERTKVIQYLNEKGVSGGDVPSEPAWFVAPLLAIWPVFSLENPGAVSWWVISGDAPTDHIPSDGASEVREALSAFSKRWMESSEHVLRGEPLPDAQIGASDQTPELGALLFRRANLLAEFAAADELWKWQE
jgi:hypothetical protein